MASLSFLRYKPELIIVLPTSLTYKLKQKIQIYCHMYNLILRESCLSDIERQDFSIISHLNINSTCNKSEMLSISVAQYVDILMLSETKCRLGHEWHVIACTHTHTCHILCSCAIIAHLNFVQITLRPAMIAQLGLLNN